MPDTRAVALVLAAGKGTRMKSELPKVLHPVAGLSMLERVLATVRDAGVADIVLVVGSGHERVRAPLDGRPGAGGLTWVLQEPQRGTGHAVQAAASELARRGGTVLVLSGDVPLLAPATVVRFLEEHRRSRARASLITSEPEDPGSYGRVVRRRPGGRRGRESAGAGPLARIVEARDATARERRIREINTGLYAFEIATLLEYVERVTPANSRAEYYLTDVFALMVRDRLAIRAVKLAPASEFLGVNDRVELAAAEEVLRQRKLRDLMLSGVTVRDPRTTYVDGPVDVGPDSVLYPGTALYGATRVGRGCEIRSGAVLRDTVVADAAVIHEGSTLEGADVGEGASVGPLAHLRPGARLARGAKVGNFVEIKNATLGERSKANHLAYLGDARVGRDTNIGAGTITCNYDGYHKHRTTIGDEVFVGSDSILVAPVTLGDRAFVAASSVVTRDVPDGALAIARGRQVNKPGYRRILEDRHREACPLCRGPAPEREGSAPSGRAPRAAAAAVAAASGDRASARTRGA
jgi:bifunctional UDP-N-acetylglucosamine pyrophosphorylase/glucosamine-1-phosphate N-acetyltransferase